MLHGSPSGLSANGNQLWTLDDPILFGALQNDHFGEALAAGDFNGDGVDDLAIGAPDATWAGQAQTGFVQIVYGRAAEFLFADGFESGNTSAWSDVTP